MKKEQINTGGSAFPHTEMTLRDYFAAKALALGGEFFHNYGNGCNDPEAISQAAYQIADAMLKARLTPI